VTSGAHGPRQRLSFRNDHELRHVYARNVSRLQLTGWDQIDSK
jgi:hypothetical protein